MRQLSQEAQYSLIDQHLAFAIDRLKLDSEVYENVLLGFSRLTVSSTMISREIRTTSQQISPMQVDTYA